MSRVRGMYDIDIHCCRIGDSEDAPGALGNVRLRVEREHHIHDRVQEVIGAQHLLEDDVEGQLIVAHRLFGARVDVVAAEVLVVGQDAQADGRRVRDVGRTHERVVARRRKTGRRRVRRVVDAEGEQKVARLAGVDLKRLSGFEIPGDRFNIPGRLNGNRTVLPDRNRGAVGSCQFAAAMVDRDRRRLVGSLVQEGVAGPCCSA